MKGSAYLDVVEKEFQPKISGLMDDMKNRKNPDFFWPTGTQVYVGRQGSGKTISAVKHVHDLKQRYPACIIVSNVNLTQLKPRTFDDKASLEALLEELDPIKEYVRFDGMTQLGLVLVSVNNGYYGVIYLIDEIHTYFNALDSKNIPMFVFTEISQQRKQRKVIIGTSQLFLRMAKPFREQCDNLFVCRTFFSFFTFYKAYDGMTLDQDYDGKLKGDKLKSGWFFQTRELRKYYDTYQKVVSGAEQYESSGKIDINLVSKKNKVNLTK